jgi:prepilin-type N-terminal cleavage/methylation domain-containing protein
MNTQTTLSNQTKKKKGGFTLIEVIAVLVLLGILAAIAVPRYIDMAATARERAIDAAVAELNGREALAWGNEVMGGYTDDATVFGFTNPTTVGQTLGTDYSWDTAVTVAGGTINFQGATRALLRAPVSTSTAPAQWN